MSDYEPGTVAVVTCCGEEGHRAFRCGTPSNMGWEIAGPKSRVWTSDSSGYVTDIRPLVVLDVESPSILDRAWENTEAAMKEGHSLPFSLTRLRDDIKAQTKPPRIPEPSQFGVVEAAANRSPGRHKWVRQGDLWWNGSAWNTWDSLIDPTLIREGLS